MAAEAPNNTIPTAVEADSVSIQSFEKTDGNIPQALKHEADVVTSRGNVITKDGLIVSTADSDTSLSGNIFADPEIRDYYKQVYEDAKYECRHVFDADASWTPEEEKAVVRKLDWRVCTWACVMFFSLQVDRGNLAQAVSGTLLKDLKLSTNGKCL